MSDLPLNASSSQRSPRPFGYILIIATGILWGTIGVVSKHISDESSLDAVSITWLRSVIASPICLLAAWLVLGKGLFRVSRRDLWFMLGLGVILVFYQYLYLASLDRIGVSAATLIALCGAPIIVALISASVMGETLYGGILLALTGAIVGTALLAGRPDAEGSLLGIGLAVGCALGIALHVLGMRSLAQRVHPLQPLAVGFPVGAVLLAPFTLHRSVSFDYSVEVWVWLLYLGLVPSSIAYLMYQRGLRDVPATVASIVTMLEPLVAALLAWIIFQERLGFWGWVGGALLLCSIALLTATSIKRSPSRKPQRLSSPPVPITPD